jgi:hypothetical protein
MSVLALVLTWQSAMDLLLATLGIVCAWILLAEMLENR